MTDRKPENNKKDLDNTQLVRDMLEVIDLESPEFLQECEVVINLFAGNLNESAVFTQQLGAVNQEVQIFGVDIEEPHYNKTQDLAPNQSGNKPEFIQADAFTFLHSTQLKADIITAYGAEFLFNPSVSRKEAEANLDLFKSGVLKVLKIGGFIHAPEIAGKVLDNDPRFRKIIEDLYQRIDEQMIPNRRKD